MALHGDIRVNGQRVGYWSCVRQKCKHDDGRGVVCSGAHTYDCTVEWHDFAHRWHQRTFTTQHRYAEGSLALASKVLAEADNGR